MASDIFRGLTSKASRWFSAGRVAAAARNPVTLRSRLVLALCLLLAAALGATGVSACGGSSTESVSPAAVVSGTPVALATSAGAQEFHGMLPYVFRRSLTGRRQGAKRLVCTYRQESSDPRLSGTVDIVINTAERQTDGSAGMWGTSRLRNQGGTWLGRWSGGIAGRAATRAGEVAQPAYGSAKGTGGYAGLITRGSWTLWEAGAGFSPPSSVGAGWIETTDGSPVPPAAGPGTMPAYCTPVVGIATLRQTAYDGPGPWVLDVEQSDPRVGGRLEGSLEEIGRQRPDGSIDYLTWCTLTNQPGAWEDPLSTAVRGPGPGFEHFQYSLFLGSGANEGLVYRSYWHFMERRRLAPGDTWVWAGWIREKE
jgi:hypothetical protein